MTREKKENLHKNIETAITLWILKKQWFWYWDSINYMCYDISKTYNCPRYVVKRVFWEMYKTNKTFKNWLSNFEI